MASTRVIRQVGEVVLLHDVLQGLYRISDGVDLTFYFDSDTKESLLGMKDNDFLDEARVMLEIASIST